MNSGSRRSTAPALDQVTITQVFYLVAEFALGLIREQEVYTISLQMY
jgi:hypothetical protein